MKNLTLRTDKLKNLDTELIGNDGNSRLDIMLNIETGEVWADEYYDYMANPLKRYDDKNIICVGTARNAIIEDEETGEVDSEGRCWWVVRIYAPNGNPDDAIYLDNDTCYDNYNVDVVLDAIKQLYGELY